MFEHAISLDASSAYTEITKDTKVVALHVLMEAGLGISQPFSGGVRKPRPGHIMPFGDALFRLLEKFFIALLFSPLFKPVLLPFLPKSLREMSQAMNECRMSFDEMIEEERAKVSGKTRSNLMSALARASGQADEENDRRYGSGGLTKDEMRGNLYIFTFAGHETTANTMAYAISLLAAYPKWQNWIVEEIDTVLDKHDQGNYEEVFPRLKRCQALMVRLSRTKNIY
jgi:cytochrome P450